MRRGAFVAGGLVRHPRDRASGPAFVASALGFAAYRLSRTTELRDGKVQHPFG